MLSTNGWEGPVHSVWYCRAKDRQSVRAHGRIGEYFRCRPISCYTQKSSSGRLHIIELKALVLTLVRASVLPSHWILGETSYPRLLPTPAIPLFNLLIS